MALLIIILLCVLSSHPSRADRGGIITTDAGAILVSVFAYRDIGPVTRMDGSGLIVKVDIRSIDRQQLPRKIEISTVQASFNTLSWDMSGSRDITRLRYFDGTGFTFTFRQGPTWPVGSNIKVSFTLLIDEMPYQLTQDAIPILKNR